LVSVIEFIAEGGLAARGDDENVGSPRNFFQIFRKRCDASGDRLSSVSQIANNCQTSSCFKKYLIFCFVIKNMNSKPNLFSKTSKIRIYDLKFFKLQQFQYFAMIFN